MTKFFAPLMLVIVMILCALYMINMKDVTGRAEKEATIVHKPRVVEKLKQNEQDLNTATEMLSLKNKLEEAFDDPHMFFAPIDKAFVTKLANIEDKNVTLFVRSSGGSIRFGQLAGWIIFEEGHKIVVSGSCSSACAELLLPAAHDLIFYDSPLIGFHGNSLSREELAKDQVGEYVLLCRASPTLNLRIRKLYEATGHDSDFWKSQYQHLVITSKTLTTQPNTVKEQYKNVEINGIKLGDIKSCYTLDVKTKHAVWYPTSEQLKVGLGLMFKGSVCADNRNCYEERLDRLYPKYTSLAVGDTVYISKGPPE